MKLKKPTPKLKGIHMMAQFYEAIILGRNADIQKDGKVKVSNNLLTRFPKTSKSDCSLH